MKLILVAVGTRLPRWAASEEYAKRMPRNLRIELVKVRPEPRSGGKSTARLLEAEAGRVGRAASILNPLPYHRE
jgi:23S rRNA (pseudouridine1915-N3)-methyltransferase